MKSTPQQVVQDDGSDVVIQPAQPDVVYVPAYNPWLVYGYPIAPWPYWYNYPGIWFGGPYLSFGLGFGIGYWGGFGWGWGHWGFDWHNHYVVYNHNRYYSRTNTFYNRNNYYQRGGERGVANNVNRGAERGGEENRGNIGGRGGEENRGNIGGRGETENRTFNDTRAARGFGESARPKSTLAPAHSAVTTMAEKLAAIRRAASPASAAEAAASTVAAEAADIIANLNSTVAIALRRYRNYL